MKSSTRSILVPAGMLALIGAVAFGQAPQTPAANAAAPAAPAAPAAGGGRGGGGGGGRGGGAPGTPGLALPMPPGGLVSGAINPNALNDLETTELTRVEMSVTAPATRAVTEARTAVAKASLTEPVNAQAIATAVSKLAEAEASLALKRADAYAQMQKTLTNLTPEKKEALKTAMGGGAGGGRGGRGGG